MSSNDIGPIIRYRASGIIFSLHDVSPAARVNPQAGVRSGALIALADAQPLAAFFGFLGCGPGIGVSVRTGLRNRTRPHAETKELKPDSDLLKGWQQIAAFLGPPVSVAQQWMAAAMVDVVVRGEGERQNLVLENRDIR
jgi:hypothetical protein